MQEIVGQFFPESEVIECKPFGNGHIHDTYLIRINLEGEKYPYILQRINTKVFKKPELVMNNIQIVTQHLRSKIANKQIKDPSRRVLTLIPTKKGNSYFKNEIREYWRMYEYVSNSISYEVLPSLDLVNSVGVSFGAFLADMRDLSPNSISETIPNFHNGQVRYQTFQEILMSDPCKRRSQAQKEINFLTTNSDKFSIIPNFLKQREIPLTITHNDTKVNNVLFDKNTNESLCIIDLDTVMPGVALFDFGDLARTTLSSAKEDEKDLNKVFVELPVFEALLEGYLFVTHSILTQREKDLIIHCTELMPLIIGMRFLTDFLQGDTYFKTQYSNHNLIRCRTQFKLVESIQHQRVNMEKIKKAILKNL